MWDLDYKESWALKNWCFWTVVLEKTLESPLDSKRSNQPILKEISPECSLEGLMLKVKLQYFGHLILRADSFEKTLMLGKIEGRGERDDRGWDGLMASLTQWTWVWINSGSWWWIERPGVLWSMGSQRVGHNWATQLNWTEANLRPHHPPWSSKVAIKAAAPCSSLAKWFTRPKRVNTTEIELLFIWLSWAAQQISRVILFHVVTQGQNWEWFCHLNMWLPRGGVWGFWGWPGCRHRHRGWV